MSQRVIDILVTNFLSIAITIVFGYYFLYVGATEREPTFYVDPARTVIIDQTNAADAAPLRILKPNLDTIQSDVASVYFYFFNQGKETIKRANVYSPIKVKVKNAEILYFKVIKTARDISGIQVSKDTLDNSLAIEFNALEKDDGFVGQIIYEGDKDAEVTIEGGIDRVKNFKSELESIPPIYILIALLILLIAAYVYLVMSKRNPKSVPKLLFFFSLIPVLYLLLMFYKTEWFIDHKVPEALRIEQYVKQSKMHVFDVSSWFKY